MACEDFTAVAMCPRCYAVGVWPWRKPRRRPTGDDPVSRVQRHIAAYQDMFASLTLGAPLPIPTFDASDAVVVRLCQCGHEWSQR